jgi:hypothetical protein
MNRYVELVDPWDRPSRAVWEEDLEDVDYSTQYTLVKNNDVVESIPITHVVVATSSLTCGVVQAILDHQSNERTLWASLFQDNRKVFTLYTCPLEGVGTVLFGLGNDLRWSSSGVGSTSIGDDLHSIARLLVDSITVDRWIILDSMANYLMEKQLGAQGDDESILVRYCLSSELLQVPSFRALLPHILKAPAALTGLSAALMTSLEIGKRPSCTIIVSENQLDDARPFAYALLVTLQNVLGWKSSVEQFILPQLNNSFRMKRDALYL